jgi:hypothetical protein
MVSAREPAPLLALAVALVPLSSSAAYGQEDPWFRRANEEGLGRNTVATLNQMFPSVGQSRERAEFVMQLRERQRAAEQQNRRDQ